jgi:DNA-binding MarR family transcriptional regulator
MWIFHDFIKTLATVNIRPVQYSIMTVIGANPGTTQIAVAKRLGIEQPRLVLLLNTLEARNLVKRIRSPTDRRSHALHLTSGGQISLRNSKMLAAEHERHVDEKIGPENRGRLLEILSAFR